MNDDEFRGLEPADKTFEHVMWRLMITRAELTDWLVMSGEPFGHAFARLLQVAEKAATARGDLIPSLVMSCAERLDGLLDANSTQKKP